MRDCARNFHEMNSVLQPPFDSVPHLIRPVACRACSGGMGFQVPSITEPNCLLPVKEQSEIVMFSLARISKRERALRADPIIPRGIHGAIADAHVAATIDIESVPIGIDEYIVDSQVVDARRQKSEPTSLQHGEVAQQDVVTILQCNRLVGDARAI
jgi:hypothetical protein